MDLARTQTRRRSSIFPQYLRRKSTRKDSTFASESTTNLWPYLVEEKRPSLHDYQNENKNQDLATKFGWINGVYVSWPTCRPLLDNFFSGSLDSNGPQHLGRDALSQVSGHRVDA